MYRRNKGVEVENSIDSGDSISFGQYRCEELTVTSHLGIKGQPADNGFFYLGNLVCRPRFTSKS